MPARPQKAAGPRIEPPVSLPVPPSTRPAATEAPVPLDEPPVKRVVSQGLRAGGQGRSKLRPPSANSWVASLPMTFAPARRLQRLEHLPQQRQHRDGLVARALGRVEPVPRHCLIQFLSGHISASYFLPKLSFPEPKPSGPGLSRPSTRILSGHATPP